jgi:hypothetical protein
MFEKIGQYAETVATSAGQSRRGSPGRRFVSSYKQARRWQIPPSWSAKGNEDGTTTYFFIILIRRCR